MGDIRLYQYIYERIGDMRRKFAVLCMATAVALVAAGCGGGEKKEAKKPTVTAAPAKEAEETKEPEATVSADETASDNQEESASSQETAKKAKKKKTKAKETTAAAEEGSSAEEIEAARAKAQAEETAKQEAQRQEEEQARLAQEEEARRLAEEAQRLAQEEEAQRIAQEQAAAQNVPQGEITDQEIQDSGGVSMEEAKSIAQSYVGASLDELIGAIGGPLREAGRMPSCQGDGTGEDAAYEYDGFTVTTYEKDGARTVTGVE